MKKHTIEDYIKSESRAMSPGHCTSEPPIEWVYPPPTLKDRWHAFIATPQGDLYVSILIYALAIAFIVAASIYPIPQASGLFYPVRPF